MRRRLALVVSGFPKLSETFIASKFAGLVERGWDAHVVCTTSERAEWERLPALMRLELRPRVHRAWPHRPRVLAAALLAPALLRCVLRNPRGSWRYVTRGWRLFGAGVFRWLYLDSELVCLAPDVVHFEFGALAAGRMHVRELLGCRVVVSFRGYDLNFAGLDETEYYRHVWDRSDALHLLGEALWRQAQMRGCPPEKLHALIPPAVDVDRFKPQDGPDETSGAADRPVRILSVGRLEWKKGYEYALRAVKHLVDEGIRCEYRIVGDGEQRGLVYYLRHLFGLEGVVEILGARRPEEVERQLSWADIFLHAAVSEGFCNAVVEAQAMAVPVVCSDAGGLPENVADGETGFVVSRRNPRALAAKLGVLARDASLRRKMGTGGRRRSLAMFRLDAQLARFEHLYGEVLQGGAAVVAYSRQVGERMNLPSLTTEEAPTAGSNGSP